jgi:hypothetical protein
LNDINEILQIFTEEKLRELAEQRQAPSQSVTIGNSYQFNKDQQLNVDLSMFISEALESVIFDQDVNDRLNAAFPPPPGVELEMVDQIYQSEDSTSTTLTAQLISNNTFSERDLHVLGLRLSNFDSYQDVVLFWNARFTPLGNWNPRPRLNFGYRMFEEGQNTSFEGERIQITPSIKLDRRFKRAWVIEFEMGVDYYQYTDEENLDQIHGLFRFGYHYTF